MWVKICGNTTLEDACLAAEAGANAVGFIFAPSPRQVEVDVVREITARLPPQLEKYGVFVDAGFDEIVSTVTNSGLSGVQLHRSPDALLPSRLRDHFAQRQTRISILGVLNYKDQKPEFAQQLMELGAERSPGRGIGGLLDSAGRRGHGDDIRLAWGAGKLPASSSAFSADCGRRPVAGKRAPGDPDTAALGSRRGERRGKLSGQEGPPAAPGVYPLRAGSGGRDSKQREQVRGGNK